ncbi:MAG: OmpL47-type beta-barrel domain-containing protein, partial [Thermoplasmatota archaeon]
PLRGVYLKIAKWKNASTLQVAVYNHTGSLLQHASIPVNSLPHINDIPTWIPIDLHVNVTPGKIHYLVCSGTNSTGWWWNSTDHYMDGEAAVSFDCGASWHPLSNTDLSFILFGEADSTPPQVTLLQPVGDEVITGVRFISWHAVDNNDKNLNGSISLYASRDGGQSWILVAEGIRNSGQFVWDSRLNKDGTAYMLKVTAVDSSGNSGVDTSDRVFIVDNSPPDSGYSLYPTPSERHNGWYTSGVTMSITATDTASGVNKSVYRIDGGAWSEYCGEFIVEGDGEHIIQFYSVDHAQHVEAQKSVGINIDATQPVSAHESEPSLPDGDNGWHRGRISVSIQAQDGTSGVESIWYTVDGGSMTMYTESVALTEDGMHTVSYNSIDSAGNEETVQSAFFKIDGEAPNVGFLQPLDGFLYVMGREILPLKQTVILGRATVEVDAFDDTAGMDRVEFYIDSNLHETVVTQPFTMVWDERVWFDRHTIKAVAYDTAGNMAVAEQDIWILNL